MLYLQCNCEENNIITLGFLLVGQSSIILVWQIYIKMVCTSTTIYKVSIVNPKNFLERTWTWTRDLLITSQTLFALSYSLWLFKSIKPLSVSQVLSYLEILMDSKLLITFFTVKHVRLHKSTVSFYSNVLVCLREPTYLHLAVCQKL